MGREHGATRLLDLQEKHPGPARNLAYDSATQPYVLFMDADDMLLPNALEKLHAVLAKHPRSVAAFGYFQRRHDGTFWPNPKYARLAVSPIGSHVMLLRNSMPAHGSILIRRSALKEDFGFHPIMDEDWHAAIHIRLSGRVHLLPEPIYDYNTAEGSMSRSRRDADKIVLSSNSLIDTAESTLGRQALTLRLANKIFGASRLRRSLRNAAAYATSEPTAEIEYE